MNARLLIWQVTAVLATGSARAATIHLSSPTGDTSMELTTTGDLQIRISTAGVDTVKVAWIDAFLDTTGTGVDADSVDVTGVTAGNDFPWVYDRSAFEDRLPTELDEAGDEYGLISGDATPVDGGYPLGEAIHVHDTLHLLNTNVEGSQGGVNVAFELGARIPEVWGPVPPFIPFEPAPPGSPPDMPNYLYIGDATSTNPAFVITIVPEPSAVLLVAALVITIALTRRSHLGPMNCRDFGGASHAGVKP